LPCHCRLRSQYRFSILYFKKKYPSAIIYAYEPNPDAFRLLQQNLNDLNGIVLYNSALSEDFFVADKDAALTDSLRQDRGGNTVLKVRTERLSSLLRKLGKVDLVKIDVEGAEWDILRDLQTSNVLTKPSRYIIEYHHQISGDSAEQAENSRIF
jgi:FkbM family methyltransferase